MPIINLENCTQCMRCVTDCPSNAIDIKNGTIASTCIHCGHCVAICPETTISPDHGEIKSLDESKINPNDFKTLVSGLRSHRKYLKKDIPDEIIEELLENMKHYASASNARPIQVTAVKSKDKIQLLNDVTAQTLLKSMKLVTSPVVSFLLKIVAPSIDTKALKKYHDSFIEKQKTNKSMVCHHAPVVLIFHGSVSKFGMGDADAYIWATHTTLLAKTMGLGSCFIGFIVKAMERNKSLKRAMQIPVKHKVYTTLTLGYPKSKYLNETSRKPPKFSII